MRRGFGRATLSAAASKPPEEVADSQPGQDAHHPDVRPEVKLGQCKRNKRHKGDKADENADPRKVYVSHGRLLIGRGEDWMSGTGGGEAMLRSSTAQVHRLDRQWNVAVPRHDDDWER